VKSTVTQLANSCSVSADNLESAEKSWWMASLNDYESVRVRTIEIYQAVINGESDTGNLNDYSIAIVDT